MYTGRQFNRYIAVSFEPQLAIDWVYVSEVQFFRSLPLSPPSTNNEYTISSSLRSTQSTTFTLMILYYILIQIIEYCTTKEHTLSMCIQLLLSNWVFSTTGVMKLHLYLENLSASVLAIGMIVTVFLSP